MFKKLTLLLPAFALSACLVVIGDEDADLHFDDGDNIVHSESYLNNQRVIQRIEDALYADPALQNADINVSAKGQNIYLHGEVYEPYLIERAVNLALADPDTQAVSSRIVLTLKKK